MSRRGLRASCVLEQREMPGFRGGRWGTRGTAGWWFCGCESLYRKNQPQWKLKPPRSLTHHAHSRVRRSHPPCRTLDIYYIASSPHTPAQLALNYRGTVPLSSETKLPRNSFANRCCVVAPLRRSLPRLPANDPSFSCHRSRFDYPLRATRPKSRR